MPSAVTCGDCGAQFEVTQKLWDDEIEGKVVRVRCKRCGAKIQLDGRNPDAAPKHSKPPPPNAREKLTSIIDVEDPGIREETPTVPLTKPGQLPAPGKLPSKGEKPAPGAATPSVGPGDLWLVSYADDDDRELSASAVKAAFEKGEIHTETLIWRDGMDEWLAITEVETFAELFKSTPATDQTGGFLGTGTGLGVGSGGPTISDAKPGTEDDDDDAPPISLVPDSLPDSVDPDSVEPKLVALSAGTMAETKPKGPPPRREASAGTTPKPGGVKLPAPKIAKEQAKAEAAEAPRVKRLPKPPAAPQTKTGYLPSVPSNPKPDEPGTKTTAATSSPDLTEKPQGKAKPRPPANLKRPQTVAFEAEEPPPDSIPDVAALSRKAGTLDKEQKKEPKLTDLPLTGSVDLGGIALGAVDDAPLAPTIKVDDLDVDVDTGDAVAPQLDSAPESAPVSSKSGKKKKKRKTQSGPPSSRKIRTETTSEAPVTRSKPAPAVAVAAKPAATEPPEEGSGSKTPLYIAVGLAAAFAVYWFGIRSGAPAEEPKPQPIATQTQTSTAETAATDTLAPTTATAEPEATAEPTAEAETDKPAAPTATGAGTDPLRAEAPKPTGTAAAAEPTPTAKPTATAEATKPAASAETPAATTKPPPDEPTPVATAPFDVAAARSALASAAGRASACRKPGDPSGIAQVTITFAPSGRATSANIGGPPFAGTATGGCIAGTMRSARVPPFTGSHKTVSKTVVIN